MASTHIVYHVIVRVPLDYPRTLAITNNSVLRTIPVGKLQIPSFFQDRGSVPIRLYQTCVIYRRARSRDPHGIVLAQNTALLLYNDSPRKAKRWCVYLIWVSDELHHVVLQRHSLNFMVTCIRRERQVER
ncbi:hypothetical protein KCV07_g322, partial [Aureobasidium melanogenum]